MYFLTDFGGRVSSSSESSINAIGTRGQPPCAWNTHSQGASLRTVSRAAVPVNVGDREITGIRLEDVLFQPIWPRAPVVVPM